MSEDVVLREELEAAMEARRELGADMEPAVIETFVARIERRLADRADDGERALKRKRDHQKEMVLGSMGISVPLFAIAAIFTGIQGVVAVCVVLAVIAIVSARLVAATRRALGTGPARPCAERPACRRRSAGPSCRAS